jgi:hypothetical protein
MAAARALKFEAERFHQPSHVGEGDIRHVAASKPREQPPRIHIGTLASLADEA